MARNSSMPSSNKALEALSLCPRQQIHRPVKNLSFELANHVNAYIDHQRYEQAYIFLHSLLTAGTCISVPAKPYVGLLASAPQLALASTLVAYPPITTKATSSDAHKGSNAALRYLRSVLDTIGGPGYKTISAAFVFSDTRRRHPAARSPLTSPTSASGFDIEQLNDAAAHSKSLWQRAEDFWHVVGWAFNCSVIHPKRWARWKLWLDVMLSFIEAEWDTCMRYGESQSKERQVVLQESLLWRYVASQDPLAGNTRKRILRAIFAAGEPQALREFHEVWDKETAEPKEKDTHRKHKGPLDFETGDMGDYDDEDEDVEMQDAPHSVASGRRSKRNATESSDASLPPLEEAFFADREAAVARLGGVEAVGLRQRLLALLAKVARELPADFASIETLFDTLTTQTRYYSAPVLQVLVTTSKLVPSEQLALNVSLVTALASQKYINYTASTPTQEQLETYLLPLHIGKYGFISNAKISIILEQIVMYMMEQDLLQPTKSLRKAMQAGINERFNVKTKKKGSEEERQSEELLETSSERLSALVELLDMTTDKQPIRRSSRKQSQFPSFSGTGSPLSSAPESDIETDDG